LKGLLSFADAFLLGLTPFAMENPARKGKVGIVAVNGYADVQEHFAMGIFFLALQVHEKRKGFAHFEMFFDEKSSLQTLIRRGFQTIRVPVKVEKERGTRIGTRMACIILYPIDMRFNTSR
jgi:hypothetical protein